MLVQDFLRSEGTLKDLETRYAIKATRHGQHPSLVLLKYNQIESPFSEQIVQECRGIILDEADDWNVVSLAFKKFFNYGEGHAATIDWSTARVYEKLDGSLMVLYPYKNEWHVASSGTPDASGPVGLADLTFQDLFWKTFKAQGLRLPQDPLFCFAFELTTPYNRVVVPHKEAKLTLLGARSIMTLQEVSPSVFADQYPVVRSFDLSSFDGILGTFASMNPLQQEGYVVCDAVFNRVKVKHPGYVAIHHLKDGMSTRRLVEIIRTGETPEFLTHFPEWTEEFNKIKVRFDALVDQTEAVWNRLKDMPKGGAAEQKAFALEALKCEGKSALFMVRAGKTASIRSFYAEMPINGLIEMLKLKVIEAQE